MVCRLAFDLERDDESVPKGLFRQLILYPAVHLDLKGEVVEARPNYYRVMVEGEHDKLNEYTAYINGVTRVVALLYPGSRECDIDPKFTSEIEVTYIVDEPQESVPRESNASVFSKEKNVGEPSVKQAPKKSVQASVPRESNVSVFSKEKNVGEPIVKQAPKKSVQASVPRESNASVFSKEKNVGEPSVKHAPKKSQSVNEKKEMTHGWTVTESKANNVRGVDEVSSDEASLTMEPVNVKNLRKTQAEKSSSTLQVPAINEDMDSFDWPETELYEESISILSRKRRKTGGRK